ncbi:MaoC family dehydratase N-terminal domain-containing protein [Streptomyces sp. NPDC058848]|uniref:FAS1-like dehydratase domain-containing protein n=1 Tax=Streptomyces TaxID=1883 RepID=UPI003681E0F5
MALNRAYLGRIFPAAEPYEVTRTAVRAFADAIGDPHPVYHSPKAARAAGHPDLLAPPTFAALIAGDAYWPLLEDPAFGLGTEGTMHLAQRFVYTRPIRAGDTLRAQVTPETMDTRAGRDRVVFRSLLHDTRGRTVVTVLTTLLGPEAAPAG